MDKNEPIVFKKYGQLYAGTFQSSENNGKVKVASMSGALHTVDVKDTQTMEQYKASLTNKAENNA